MRVSWKDRGIFLNFIGTFETIWVYFICLIDHRLGAHKCIEIDAPLFETKHQ